MLRSCLAPASGATLASSAPTWGRVTLLSSAPAWGSIGYLVMDLDQDVANPVCNAIVGLQTDIKTRIVS